MHQSKYPISLYAGGQTLSQIVLSNHDIVDIGRVIGVRLDFLTVALCPLLFIPFFFFSCSPPIDLETLALSILAYFV